MAAKKKRSLKLTRGVFWKATFAAMLLACIGLGVMLWLSGIKETQDAFAEGRRLLVKLDSGDIQGKYIPDPDVVKLADPLPEATEEEGEQPATEPEPAVEPSSENKIPGALAPFNPALSEKSKTGPLPFIGRDGAKPWRYYAKPFERQDNSPIIAVIVTGLGSNKVASETAIKLPDTVTLSFSPYAQDVESWVVAARSAGHEVLLDLPLEPSNYPATDPGPYGLMTDKDAPENKARLHWLMGRARGYVGFTTPHNEVYSSNNEGFKFLLQDLAGRGLMLAMGGAPHKEDTKDMLEAGNTASVVADVLIDEELSEAAINARLASLEQQAKKRGYAIGIAQAFPITLHQLQRWAAALAPKGFILVPVSAIARLRYT